MDMHRKNDVPLSLTQRAVKQLRCGQIIIRTGRIGMCQRQNSLTCISHAGVRPEVLNRRKLICGKAIIRDSAVRPMRTERRRGEIRERNRLQLFSRDRVRRRSDLPGCRRVAAGNRQSGDQTNPTLRRLLHRSAPLQSHQGRSAVLLPQRSARNAPGCDDVIDDRKLRHDPVRAIRASEFRARRAGCAPLAAKSSL